MKRRTTFKFKRFDPGQNGGVYVYCLACGAKSYAGDPIWHCIHAPNEVATFLYCMPCARRFAVAVINHHEKENRDDEQTF